MSESVKLIVNSYVRLKNKAALEEIREHRQRMRKQLEEVTGSLFDVSALIQKYDLEIEIIQSGLNQLQPPSP